MTNLVTYRFSSYNYEDFIFTIIVCLKCLQLMSSKHLYLRVCVSTAHMRMLKIWYEKSPVFSFFDRKNLEESLCT